MGIPAERTYDLFLLSRKAPECFKSGAAVLTIEQHDIYSIAIKSCFILFQRFQRDIQKINILLYPICIVP